MRKGFRARCVRLCGAGMALLTWSAAIPAAEPSLHDSTTCARPSLWVVSDADTIIYLFGTIHTHDGRAHWFDHAVRRAFDASDALVLETIVPATLPKVVTAPSSGLATVRAVVQSGRDVGLSVALGADQVLHRAANAEGKPVIGLESFAEQLKMYQRLPSPARPAATAAAATQPDQDSRLAGFLRSIVDNWNRGNSAQIEAVVGSVQQQSPDAYKQLFNDRNQIWAKWISARLQQPGTVFVAVGTGHLVGSDSVQAKLAAAGVRSARIN